MNSYQPRAPFFRRANWANPLTRGLEFLFAPGLLTDAAGKIQAAPVIAGTVRRYGGSIRVSGATGTNGVTVGAGGLLGPLANSTAVGIARHVTGANINASGNAIYSERDTAGGNDIYKLGCVSSTGLRGQFTYRNDGGNLLQLNTATADARLSDSAWKFYAARKNGTTHDVYYQGLTGNGTFGSASTAFTEAAVSRGIGYDPGDTDPQWDGEIALVAGWSRTLEVSELYEIRRDPWQLFVPISRKVYSFGTASGFQAAWARNANAILGSGAFHQ